MSCFLFYLCHAFLVSCVGFSWSDLTRNCFHWGYVKLSWNRTSRLGFSLWALDWLGEQGAEGTCYCLVWRWWVTISPCEALVENEIKGPEKSLYSPGACRLFNIYSSSSAGSVWDFFPSLLLFHCAHFIGGNNGEEGGSWGSWWKGVTF